MRVVLATQHADRDFIPLALLYLKAALAARNVCAAADVTVLEFGNQATVEDIATAVAAAQPDVVGLSCHVWNVTRLLAAAALIKARQPATRIVLGGPEVGPVAAAVMEKHSCIDAIVRSEGEALLPEIV